MTPCYAPFKNLLIVLENAFEVIVKDKNNIFLRKTTKKRQKMEKKNTFFSNCCPPAHKGLWAVFFRGLGGTNLGFITLFSV